VIVDKEFEAVLEEIQRDRIFVAKFEHSLPIHVENWTDRFATLHVRDVDKTYTVDPIRLFFYLKSNLRVIDMFREIDMDGDGYLGRDEIKFKLLVSLETSYVCEIMAFDFGKFGNEIVFNMGRCLQ
jgi:hypothetical protein